MNNKSNENISPPPIPGEIQVRKTKGIKREVKAISIIIFLVLIFRSIIIEPFRIPSGSMLPTLFIGDFILVNKTSYGLKVPFSDINLFGFDSDPIYLFGKSSPKRGDVIVFKYPQDKSINFIKRVIGVPGDTIEIKDKRVLVNGELLQLNSVGTADFMKDMNDKFKDVNLNFFKTTLKNKSFYTQLDQDNFYRTDYPSKKIPKGHYFVLGDNRDFSHDSRFWGLVPEENIKGEALIVWFSANIPIGSSQQSLKFRFWRVGKLIN